MNVSLQNRCRVHHAQKQRAIDENVIERRSVEIRRDAERRPTAGAELNEFFHAPSTSMKRNG
jgi:hypothetical protein